MFKPAFLAVSIAATSFASTASADNFNILFVDGGFFPEITYLMSGDTVTFINETDLEITAEAIDQSWSTGNLPLNASYVLPIVEDIMLDFTVADDLTKVGYLSFDPAPLSDVIEADDGEVGVDTSTD